MSKVFIIGLPRTGTTSISVALLDAGLKVAHTAFTQQAFALADAISDAPCFSDFEQLDKLFPGAKFIYLTRDLTLWVPSMQRLLVKMSPNLLTRAGHFSPVLKRAFNQTFHLEDDNLLSVSHLTQCYLAHQTKVRSYFEGRNDLLTIDISDADSFKKFAAFLDLPYIQGQKFPHINIGTQVAKWTEIKHVNKVSSFSAGKNHRRFFDYQ